MDNIADWVDLRAKLTLDLAHFFSLEQAPGGQRYALVDAAQVPDMRGPAFDAEGLDYISLFTLTREHAIAKYGPLLIPLSPHAGPKSPSVARIVRAMRHGWTVSWLTSPLELEALAEHLAGHLNGTLPDGSDVLVRYYDPRLLPVFLDQLDKTTSAALLAPIGHWAWWDRQLGFVLRQGGGQAASPGITDTAITPETQQAMADAALVDLIGSMVLAECGEDEFGDWLPHTFYKALRGQVARAHALGLTDMADVQLFVSLALRIHPEFFSLLPVFAREHQRIRAGDIDMPSLVLAVDDGDWDRLGASGRPALEHLRRTITRELSTIA